MFTSRRLGFVALVGVLLLVAACTPTAPQPNLGPGPQVFVTPGPTETILISTEDIPQNNCSGGAEMSQTVERAYTVSRTVDLGTAITVDAGGRAGIPGVGEVGVGAAVASHYNVSYGSEETVTRSVTVKAPSGSHILHTVRQNMIWETGTVMIPGVAEPIPYRFRKDFSMETLPPANIGCPGQAVQPLPTDTSTDAESSSGREPQEPVVIASPPTNTPLSASSGITAGQLDSWFGSGNWFCFPDRTNGIGVRSLPVNVTVMAPMRYIDTYYGRTTSGDTAPSVTGATVELTEALPVSQCPGWQQSALSSWSSSRGSGRQITTGAQMDGLFGAGNWGCLPDYPFGAKVYFYNANFGIEYPFTTADISDGTKYGVGETVNPNGEMTVWFAGSIPREQCP